MFSVYLTELRSLISDEVGESSNVEDARVADTHTRLNTNRTSLTEGILQVLLSHKFEVFLYGLCGKCVLSEDEMLILPTAVHL